MPENVTKLIANKIEKHFNESNLLQPYISDFINYGYQLLLEPNYNVIGRNSIIVNLNHISPKLLHDNPEQNVAWFMEIIDYLSKEFNFNEQCYLVHQQKYNNHIIAYQIYNYSTRLYGIFKPTFFNDIKKEVHLIKLY